MTPTQRVTPSFSSLTPMKPIPLHHPQPPTRPPQAQPTPPQPAQPTPAQQPQQQLLPTGLMSLTPPQLQPQPAQPLRTAQLLPPHFVCVQQRQQQPQQQHPTLPPQQIPPQPLQLQPTRQQQPRLSLPHFLSCPSMVRRTCKLFPDPRQLTRPSQGFPPQ